MNGMTTEIFDRGHFFPTDCGPVTLKFLDPNKNYQGKMYRLSKETVRQLAEIAGFSASFELAGVKSATMELFKNYGTVILEIERQAQPAEVVVRYMRERWNEISAPPTSAEVTRTIYQASTFPSKALSTIAEQLRVPPDEIEQCVIRINFKERICALISTDLSSMPIGSYHAFSISSEALKEAGHRGTAAENSPPDLDVHKQVASMAPNAVQNAVSTSPESSTSPFARARAGMLVDKSKSASAGANSKSSDIGTLKNLSATKDHNKIETVVQSTETQVPQPKPASSEPLPRTVAREDRLTTASDLAEQEKRLIHYLILQMETATTKLQETNRLDFETFKQDFTKELEQHRSQFQKTLVPITKIMEESLPEKGRKDTSAGQLREMQTAAVPSPTPSTEISGIKNMLMFVLALLIGIMAALFWLIIPQTTSLEHMKVKLEELSNKIDQQALKQTAVPPAVTQVKPPAAGESPATTSSAPSDSAPANSDKQEEKAAAPASSANSPATQSAQGDASKAANDKTGQTQKNKPAKPESKKASAKATNAKRTSR